MMETGKRGREKETGTEFKAKKKDWLAGETGREAGKKKDGK